MTGRATVEAWPGNAHLCIFGSDFLVISMVSYGSQDKWKDKDEDQKSAKYGAHDGAGNATMRERPGHEVASSR